MSGPYSEVVMDHFHSPRNAFRTPEADVVGRAGSPGQGNFMLLYLVLDGARVRRASFQTYGCCPAIAAGSLLVERLEGLELAQAARWDAARIERALGGLPRSKRHCSRLAADALQDALTRLHEARTA